MTAQPADKISEPSLLEESLFLRAIELGSAEEQAAFLDRECSASAELRHSVEALLRHHREGSGFLESPPTEVLAAGEQLTAREPKTPVLDFLAPSAKPASIGRLGSYEILEVLGSGGFGVVLKASDTKLNRVVAIKVLAPELASNPTARKRFEREARAAAAVVHQHIVTIHAVDEDRLPYLVMECVDGQSLKEKIDREGQLKLVEIVRIGQQVAAGLAAAHAHGLMHRDVKPANILLENGIERVRITDFGLARAVDDVGMTRTGDVAGTPQYMSPEQAQGLPMDIRSDLFSFGCVLYAMCTGRPPFRADSTPAVLHRVCHDTPRPIQEINPEIPDWLVAIVDRLLEKQPADRYQSAQEVAALLAQYLAHLQQPALMPRPEKALAPPRKTARRWQQWSVVALIALLAVACAFGLTEASGVTKLMPTVIRIVRGEGTLVIELDDPTVQVSLDGEELSIRGAGLKELKLLPGQYRLHATKDGQPVKDEVVTVTRDGRKVVTVTLESSGGPGSRSAAPALEQPVGELTLLTKLQGHTNIVHAVSFLPDGQRMVSVDQNSVVRTWDLETRSVLSTLDLKGGRCSVADVSADGRFVAISASAEKTRMIRVWDLQDRKQICEAVHQQDVEWLNCIRFTPDGTHVLTSGKPHVGVLWNIATGKEVQRFEVHDLHSTGAAQFSPDGRLLAMEGRGRVRLFDVESGELQGDVQTSSPGGVISLAFSPSGDLLACGHMGGRTDVFEVNSRQLTASLTNDKSSSHVVSMRFIDNERLLITRFGGAFEVWDLPRTKIVATAASETGTTKRLAVSPHGRYALTAHGEIRDPKTKSLVPNGDYALRLWQLPASVWPKEPEPTPEDLKLLAKLNGHSDLVRGVAFLPDGRRFVSVGRDKVVRIWDLATRSILSTLPVEGYLRDADVSADGRLVAMVSNSGDKKGVVQVWDIEKQERLCELVQDVNFSNCIRFSPDGTCVVTIGSPSIGILWDLTTKKEIGRFDVVDPFSVQAIEFSPDGRRLAIGASGRVRLFDIESGDVVGDVLLPQPRAVISLAFSSDGKSLACGQMGGSICLVDVERRQLTAWLTNPKSSSHVISMRFLDNERLLLTRFHGTIEVWDRARMKIVATAASETGTTKRLALSPDGRYALTADGEGWDDKANKPKPTGDYALRLWQLPESVWPKEPEPTPEDLKLLAKLEGHSDIVPVVAFVPDGRRIISVGRDQTVSVWDVQSRSKLSSLPVEGYLAHADLSADGRFAAMVLRLGGKDKVIQVWDLEKRERVCELVHDSQWINSIRLSPDGTSVAATSGIPACGVLWDVATAKELRRFDLGETSWTEGAAFSPDGRVLALGAVGRVRLFDIESGDALGDISLPDDRTVSDLEFGAKGKTLASGQAGGHVSLVDVDARRVIKRLQGSVADLRCLRFLANDTFLLTSSQDGTLRVWDLERGKVVATATTEKGTNGVVSVSPEGRHVVTANQGEWDKESRSIKGNGDYALRLWQLPESVWPKEPEPTPEDLKLLAKLDGHTDVVNTVAFLPDERMVSGGNRMVRVWDLSTRSVTSTLPFEGNVLDANVSANERLVAVLCNVGGKLLSRVWDIEKREVICEFAPEKSSNIYMRFSPDGKRVVTSSVPSPYAILWDAATGKELGRFDTGDANDAPKAAFSPDGRLLALGAVGRVRLFDIESRDVVIEVRLPNTRAIWDLGFAPSGKALATGQAGGHVSIIALDSRRVKTLQASDATVRSLRFLGGDRFLLTSTYDATLRVWDVEQGRVVAQAATENGTNRGLFVSPDGRLVITAGGKEWDEVSGSMKDYRDYALRLWQLPESVWPKEPEPTPEDLKLLAKLDGHTDVVRAAAFLPDGKRMVSVGRDQLVRIVDVGTRTVLSTLPVEGYLRDADISADGRLVAVVSNANEKPGAAHVWDIEKRERLCELVGDFDWTTCIRFSPDDARVVTSGTQPFAILWDLATGSEVRRFDVGETVSQTTIVLHRSAFSPDGRRLALGTVGRVRLFDVDSGDVLGDVSLPSNRSIPDLVFTSSGKTLASGQAGGDINLIDVDSRKVVKTLQGPDSTVLGVRFLNQDRFLLTTCDDGSLRVWDIQREEVVATAVTGKGSNGEVSISADGRHAVTAGGETWDKQSSKWLANGDYSLRLWQLPETVWAKGSPSPSSSAETAKQAVTPKDP